MARFLMDSRENQVGASALPFLFSGPRKQLFGYKFSQSLSNLGRPSIESKWGQYIKDL